jgi:putative MATE family efflux protein
MSTTESTNNLKETCRIAWPSVTESVLIVLAGMVDTYMVSTLGKASVAGVGVTNQPKYFAYTMFYALNTAIASMVARRLGQQRRKDANGMFLTALVFVTVVSVVMGLLCVIFAQPILLLFGANPQTLPMAVPYWNIVMGFSVFNLVSMYINAAQRGCGNTRIAMTTNLTSNIVNVIMNYLLINGHCGFPALGINGAAIATVLGTVIAFFMSVRSLFKKDSFVQAQYIRAESIRPSRESVKELVPMSGTLLSENLMTRLGFAITGALTARIGTDPYSAHIVGMTFMNLGFAFGDGLQSAMVALVGKSVGENNPAKAKSYVRSGQKFGLVISVIVAALMLVLDKQIFGLYFPNDPIMLEYGQLISRFIAVIMPIQVAKIVFNGMLTGAGDVRFTLIGSTIGVTIVQSILMYFLIIRMRTGLTGVWVSILISQAVQLALFSWRYFSGRWMTAAQPKGA